MTELLIRSDAPTEESNDTKILNILTALMSGLEAIKDQLDNLEEKIQDMDRDYGSGFDIRRYDN